MNEASRLSDIHARRNRRHALHPVPGGADGKDTAQCDNNAGICFEDNEVKRVVTSRAGAKAYYVSVVNGEATERVLEPEMIS